MKPPTFFLSSTIYDFSDLRSAIKYHLEQQGCRVLMSDQNDFPKPLDIHSYEACLKAIAEADFFVLLIGGRVGGWYDEEQRISITQQEYREAYQLHQQGKLKILSFVRSEIWQMREERKALWKCVSEANLDLDLKRKIVNHPSKIVDDPEFTVRFIEEVGKNRETSAAAKGAGTFPTGNWVHRFNGFPEVIDQIRIQAFNGLAVEEATIRRLLRQELLELLRLSLLKTDHRSIMDPSKIVEKVGQGIHGSLDVVETVSEYLGKGTRTLDSFDFHRDIDSVAVDRQDLFNLLRFVGLLAGKLLMPRILPEAIKSSAFLLFDPTSGTMSELPVHQALLKLLREIELFARFDKLALSKGFMPYMNELTDTQPSRSDTVRASKLHLSAVMQLLLCWARITMLCKSIILHLDGEPFSMPRLCGTTQVDQDQSRFEATDEELRWYLQLPIE